MEIIESKKEWQRALESVDQYDCYHTYEYHMATKNQEEKPILLFYKNSHIIIGIPFLLRRIYETNYYDLTSVYGYVGPVSKILRKNYDLSNFKKELSDFFESYRIISVFSRLNPFISNQLNIITDLGKVKTMSKIVVIDLEKNVEEQRAMFSKTTKRYINKANKKFSVKISRDIADIEIFIDLYYENMDRVGANKSYYFGKHYFEQLLNCSDFTTTFLFAVDKETDEIISGAIMFHSKIVTHYHLSGTRNDFMHLTPVRLLIDTMRLMANEENHTFFNLGGGLGSSGDSLFQFKSSFSKTFFDFKTWNFIIDTTVYDNLSIQYAAQSNSSDFFPSYRNT